MEFINQTLVIILAVLETVLCAYFFISAMYILVFSIAGHFYKKREYLNSKIINSIAVFIPAYKEDSVIVDVAKEALKQHYQTSKFDVIIIADSLKKETLSKLYKLPITVVEVSFDKSTKAKALNTALNSLDKKYDYAMILDADNIMEVDFLSKMNSAFNKGFKVVQGHRKAKNLNTTYAILDAASEEINNHIYRRGHSALKLSSGLIGSGMAFEYQLFKSIMKPIQAIGGFDKELEFELAKQQIHIEYLQDANVLDEKIQKASDFSNQRRRWLATQFIYLKKYYKSSFKELLSNANITFFDKVWQMIVLPRILLLGVTTLITAVYLVIHLVFNISTTISNHFWLYNLAMVIAAFLLALPKSFYNLNTFRALASIPSAFLRMFALLFKLKGANKKFIHTVHGVAK